MSAPIASVGFVAAYFDDLKQCIDSIPIDKVAKVADCLLEAYDQGKLVAIMGNGGSAATASHMACDLGKTILGDNLGRGRFRVLSLTDNAASVSAWANDVGYETIFAQQLRSWLTPGDVVIAISGSGNSENICEGVQTARSIGAYTIGLLGFSGGQVASLVDLPVIVPSDNYGHIEDLHMMFGHLVTAYIRETLNIRENGILVPYGNGNGNGKAQSAYPRRR